MTYLAQSWLVVLPHFARARLSLEWDQREVPANITLSLLPPYSPELNPIERLWHWLREHQLGNRIYINYDDLFESGCRAWNTLTPERLKTVCATSWIERTN